MPEPAKTPEPPHPTINAVLICDLTIREEGSGKTSLIGIFENVTLPSFPRRLAQLSLYAKVTDAEGNYKIRLELVRLADMQKVGLGELDVTLSDRHGVGEFVFELIGLGFERPGRYDFRLYANGRYLGNKTFSVVELRPKPRTGGVP